MNSDYTCRGRILEADILKAVCDGLRIQALTAVELNRLWEEQCREQKRDTAAMKKSLNRLKDAYRQYSQQITSLYEFFALGEIDKTAYLAAKAALTKQKDAVTIKITELTAGLDNAGTDGRLQNDFVSTFEKYIEVDGINEDIVSEVLKEVRVYPDGRLEIIWNFQDDLEKLLLDLQRN